MSYIIAGESDSILALKSWLAQNKAGFHSKTSFCQGSSGSGIIATEDLPKDLTVASCPYGLIITQDVAKTAIQEIFGRLAVMDANEWNEKQWISTYLSLHWIIGPFGVSVQGSEKLAHACYLDTLPPPGDLMTPLHFTPSELELYKGTNLYGATLDRERDWRKEWSQCNKAVAQANTLWGELFTWEKYLTAATYISSRAFPSSLLSRTPSLLNNSSTQPVLIPGVDALNHSRGQPVSWVVSYPQINCIPSDMCEEPTLSLVIHTSAVKGQEIFNNYGPKPNAELILGYGFALPNNPEDTIVLKIGGLSGKKWEIGRGSKGAEGLWKEIVDSFVRSTEEPTYEDVLDASGMLQEMVEALIQRLPSDRAPQINQVRPYVAAMFQNYLEGQMDILSSLMEFARAREQDAIRMARDEGIDLMLEDN